MPANRLFIKSATWMVALISTMIAVLAVSANTTIPKGWWCRRVLGAAAVVACLGLVWCGAAAGDAPAPGWELSAVSYPTVLAPGGKGLVRIDVFDTGAAASVAGATLTDTLPAGLTAVSQVGSDGEVWECSSGSPVTCTTIVPSVPAGDGGEPVAEGNGADGTEFTASPGTFVLAVKVGPGAKAGEENRVTVAGGGAAAPASVSETLTVGSSQPGFGVAAWDGWFSSADGFPDTQAGSHPYEATFALSFNTLVLRENDTVKAGGEIKEVETVLPAGLIANPAATPLLCTRAQLDNPDGSPECPAASQVGVVKAGLAGSAGAFETEFPIYNLVPPAGIPAQFGFSLFGIDTFLDGSARTGSNYELVGRIGDIVNKQIVHATVILWGTPAEASHDLQRCSVIAEKTECGLKSEARPLPLLTLPTSCPTTLETTVYARAWPEQDVAGEEATASFKAHDQDGTPLGITGCEDLAFAPTLSVAPDTPDTDTPAGLAADVRVPQEGLSSPENLAAADIKNTTVTLPEGFTVNPGQAAGLQACQPSQSALGSEAAPSCPPASKVGTVKVKTPLLENAAEKELEGNVYVLQSNPPELKLLVAFSADGVNIKLEGIVHLNETTGQLTSTFTGTPQIPFSDLRLSFDGGAQAALDTPTQCGEYTSTSDFTPWASPLTDALPASTVALTAGPNGTPCPPAPLPFSPSLSAGSSSTQAGAYTNLTLQLATTSGQQRIQKLSFTAPPGLTGNITNVPVCTNTQAETDTCPQASQIGHTIVQAGPGTHPLVVPEPGQPPAPVYLTGPYQGAPFGLEAVVPLHVGPFTLPTQTVRSRIEINPHTAQITVTTDPLPQILDGVPTDIRTIQAIVEHPDFTLNPTSCNPASFTGTAVGTPPPPATTPTSTAPLQARFQVGGCENLRFTPKFTATATGKTSKLNGASLTVHIAFPHPGPQSGNQSGEANIARVHVELPKSLPARLTTLQKACTEKQFASNPAGCPAESVVGHAKAITPILPVPLEGPAYFVSHGGAAFPELIMVLQGYGVTIQLNGETFINGKTDITSSTFAHVPDAPVSSFELNLPEGKYSALAANGNLCQQKLTMPTAFVAQNGAEVKQNTHIEVEGCPKTISISSESVKKRTLTLTVYVPAAGKLTATGKGITTATKSATGQENVALTLNQTKAGKLKTKVKISFTPSKGKKQSKTIDIKFKK